MSIDKLQNSLQEAKSNGLFNTIFNTSTIDTNAINIFNNAIADGIDPQQAYAVASKNTNRATKALLKSTNGLAVSSSHLTAAQKASTLAATMQATALKAAAAAANMLSFMAISMGIQLIVTGLDNVINASQKCKERTDELMSAYHSAINKANENAKKAEELSIRYEELSEGVNNLGENISLTTDEYKEYNSIVNEIAGMFPQLITGYTEEGNAILSLKGNVQQLKNAYKEAQAEAYNMLVVSGENGDGNDIVKNAKNVISGSAFGLKKGNQEKIDLLDQIILASSNEEDLFKLHLDSLNNDKVDMFDKYTSIGGKHISKGLTDAQLNHIRTQAKTFKQIYQAEINSAVDETETLANAFLMTNENYNQLNNQAKTLASILANNLDAELVKSFNGSKEFVGIYVDNIVQTLLSNSDIANTLANLFNMETSDLSIEQLKEQMDDSLHELANALGEDSESLKLRFGFDEVDDLYDKYEHAITKAKKKFSLDDSDTSLNEFFAGNSINTIEELDNWLKIVRKSKDINDAQNQYLESLSAPKQGDIFPLSENQQKQIEQVQSTITTLKDSLSKLKAGSLTITDVSKLLTDFPQLNSYVDMTASSFGSLQEGLEQLIQTTPEDLLNSLMELSPTAAEDKLALDNLISSIQLLSGLKPDLSMNGLLSTYDQLSAKLTNLADLQAALGSSFSLTAEEARKFGEVFPRLLSLGETSSDGIIRFNQDAVNHFIDGKQAEINADRQAVLAQLEHRKSVITAQMGLAQMELALLQSKYNQEILAENQKNQAISEASQNIAQYLLHLGTAQANADADSKEVMADNIIEYDRIVSEVASNLFSNLSGSSSDAGANVRLFSSSMIDSLQSVAEQAANTGKTIQSIGTGSIFTAAKKGLGQLPAMFKSFHPKSILKGFKKTLNDTLRIDDYMATQKEVKLRLDIEGYQNELSDINASIAMLESMGNTPLNLFGKNNSGTSGSSGGSGGSDSPAASELDYVRQSIEQLREQMELLQVDIGQLSFSGQEERITGIITKYNQLVGVYKQTREAAKQDWLLKSQGLSQELKAAISSGAEFTPEQFDGQAQYQQITAAKDAWVSYQKSLQEVKIITDSLAEDFVNLYQAMNESEDYQLKLLDFSRKKAENQISDAQAMNQTANPHSYEQLLSLSRQEQQYYEKKLGNAIRILEVTKENDQAYLKMQEEIQGCEDALYNCKKEQREWHLALLELPVKQLEQANEQLDKSLSKLNKSKDSKDSAISGALDILDTQKEDLEKQLGSINQFYDDQIAALREANEERSRAIELEQAAADLEKAQTQKTKKVLKDGQWVWEADLEAIREAKQGYEDLLLENQVEELEKKKELDASSIQKQIDELEDYRKKWEEISSSLEAEQNRATLAAQYGLTLEQVKEQILNKNLDLVTQMTLGYQEIQAHITSLEQEKIRNEELMQTVQDYISEWQNGEIGIQEAKEAIEVIVEDNQIELDSMAQRRDSVAAYSGTWESATGEIAHSLTGLNATEAIAKDQEAEIMAMRLANLSAFQANYQQSFTDMAANFSLSMDTMAAKFAETAGQIEANALRISEAVRQAAQAREELSSAGKASKDLSHTSEGPIRVGNKDSNSGPGVEKHHSGVLAGYVGGNGQKEKLRLDTLTKLSTQPLDHNEIPIIAREGEVLFTKSQQEMLLKNIGNLSIFQPIIPKPDYRQLAPVISKTNPGGNVNFNGDIIVQEVKDADGLAKAIKQQLPSITMQQIYSIK